MSSGLQTARAMLHRGLFVRSRGEGRPDSRLCTQPSSTREERKKNDWSFRKPGLQELNFFSEQYRLEKERGAREKGKRCKIGGESGDIDEERENDENNKENKTNKTLNIDEHR